MTEAAGERRIVVGVDGSGPSKAALRWGVEQGRLTGARVYAVAAWEDPIGFGVRLAVSAEDIAAASRQMLTEAVAELGTDIDVATRAIEGHPATTLIDESRGAELLVVGGRGHGGFVAALLGSVSQYCVQHAECTVVVVRGA